MIDELFVRFDGAFSENTLRAYRSDFQQYEAWCATKKQPTLPATADLIAKYVDFMATENRSATIRRRINSLGTIFRLSKNPDPTKEPEVVLALKRMHRKIGRHQEQAAPLTRDILDQLLKQCGNDAKGHRDRVLLLLGYETMRRRSELCDFAFEDITRVPGRGQAIRLVRSKTDQEGLSKLIPISTPLHSLLTEWQEKYQLEGVILKSVDRHGNVGDKLNSGSIGIILNRLTANLENDENICRFSGHSFRVGAAIDLLEAGASLETIMLRGGWRSQDNALNYLRSW
ncbi:tyrosine-type recombinase/integrase [Luminiphilus sp.]|nr:tyrosine-type recombinase/integrase [Luminiphilus sp.]